MSPEDSQPKLSFSFPAPKDGRVDVLVIAGEHSGDEHAARMVGKALEKNPDLRVSAIGGRELERSGAQLLFDLTQFSVVGFVEVLKNLRKAFKLRDEIIRWIREHRPKAVCFVDYPGLNLSIAEILHKEGLAHKAGGDCKLLYYISPQVWAWKEKRKFKMDKLLDSLAVIFPFEVSVFEGTGLEARFVGHPFLAADYQLPVRYAADGPILLLPGSRSSAVKRIAPILFQSFREFLQRHGDRKAVCVYASDALRDELKRLLREIPAIEDRVELVPNSQTVAASAVLTSSGTMSLNCALAGIPGAVAYKTHPVTYLIGRAFVKIPYIGIANLLIDKPLYPEFIQGEADPSALSSELACCIEEADRVQQTKEWASELRSLLDRPSTGGAASWLLEHLAD